MSRRSPGRIRTIPQRLDRQGKLPTGVEGQNIPTDFSIPPVGLEDVDRAMFRLFEDRIAMQVTQANRENSETTKVPTIFAGGERFALAKKNTPIRDKNNTLILPIVSIRRSAVEQSQIGIIPGRGVGQDTGELVIKQRLSREDPRYQNLINKQKIQNQDNVASEANVSVTGALTSRRLQPGSYNNITGEALASNLGKNIFEVITIPFPHFYTATYEITFWTQYVQHMNQMVERFMSCYDSQNNSFKLDTPKGYWFVAYVNDDLSQDDNFSDYSKDERVIRVSFSIRVPAYIVAPRNPGDPNPFRRFLSAPQISFGIFEGTPPVSKGGMGQSPVGSGDIDKFTLSDIELLDKRGNKIDDPRIETEKVKDFVEDPFTGEEIPRLLRVVNRNMRSGETVISKRIFRKIDDVNI